MVVQDSLNFDVVVVGGGAAGLTAALYSARHGLKVAVLTTEVGGQAATTMEIENYPGVAFASGPDLMLAFKKQTENFGAKIILDEVLGLEKDGEGFLIKTHQNNLKAKAVILAFGLTPRKLGLKEENKFLNFGLSYCATCDGPLFKNKVVAVVGGGPAGLEAAEYLSFLATKVYLVVKGEKLVGEMVIQDKIKNNQKIEIIYSAEAKELKGEQTIEKVVVSQKQGDKTTERELEVQGLFIKIGYTTNSSWLPEFIARDGKGQIITNKDTETNCSGVFAAGDITNIDYKQIIISAGEGAKAALRSFQYIQKNPKLGLDWGKNKS